MSAKDQERTEEQDLKEIEKLHQADMLASKQGDLDGLKGLVAEDIVLIYPDRDPVIGEKAYCEEIETYRKELKNLTITQYLIEFDEVQIIGDHAYEWGRFHHRYLIRGQLEELVEKGRLMRILRRDPNGLWKVARAIWTKQS